jgi:hypothetical protein
MISAPAQYKNNNAQAKTDYCFKTPMIFSNHAEQKQNSPHCPVSNAGFRMLNADVEAET